MLEMIKIRMKMGLQAIPDLQKAALPVQHRGLPKLDSSKCAPDCHECVKSCPTDAIQENPLKLNLGKCIFCGDCVRACPSGAIQFTPFHKIAADSLDKLIVDDMTTPESYENMAIQSRKEIYRIFDRSLKLRAVSAGGCNGCEMELNACTNVNFDMGRFGIDIVASPRHADGIVIIGTISENMASALEDTYTAIPQPKIVISAGACAISGGIFANSPALNRDFLQKHPIDLYIPGCPFHPLTFINGLLSFLKKIK